MKHSSVSAHAHRSGHAKVARLREHRKPHIKALYLVAAIAWLLQSANTTLKAIGIDLARGTNQGLSLAGGIPYQELLVAIAWLLAGITCLFQYRIELTQGPLKRYRKTLKQIPISELEQTMAHAEELSELERNEVWVVLSERRPGWSQSADRA